MKKAVLPPLTFPVDALEPYYDAKTVGLHHGKHHQAYVNGYNAALDKLDAARAAGDFAAVKHWSREIAFHGGGHILHSLFWANLKPGGGGEPARRPRQRHRGPVRLPPGLRQAAPRRHQRRRGLGLGDPGRRPGARARRSCRWRSTRTSSFPAGSRSS